MSDYKNNTLEYYICTQRIYNFRKEHIYKSTVNIHVPYTPPPPPSVLPLRHLIIARNKPWYVLYTLRLGINAHDARSIVTGCLKFLEE